MSGAIAPEAAGECQYPRASAHKRWGESPMTDGGAKALLQTAAGDPGLKLALGDTPLGQGTLCSILEIPARCKRLTRRVTKKASFRSPPAARNRLWPISPHSPPPHR